MKRMRLIACMLCALLVFPQATAFAFTIEKLNPKDIMSPELYEKRLEILEEIEEEKKQATPATPSQKTDYSSWAEATILAALEAGIVPAFTGDPSYQAPITREQFAELVAQTVSVMLDKELPAAPVDTFIDTKNEAVLKANKAGIISGIGEGKFDPKTTTNREQIASMVARSIAYVDQETGINLAPNAANIDRFADKGQVSKWAVGGVGTLAANGIMSGTSATTLSPKNPCTVQESIMLCYRVYTQYQDAK